MAINISIYSNANSSSKSVTVDFQGDILAASHETYSNTAAVEYYFKLTTSARQDNGIAYPVKIIRSLSELVLNRNRQRQTNTNAAYTSVHTAIVDYIYDYINGHTANMYLSKCTEQRPMDF